MSDKIYILYKTTNIKNGKFYIGKHAQVGNDFDGYLGSGKLLKQAISKYGSDSFVRETIQHFETEEECYLAEKEYLDNFWQSDKCYNMITGGLGVSSGKDNPRYGTIHSDETINKIKESNRKAHSGKILSDATKKKISKTMSAKMAELTPEQKSERVRKSMNAPHTYTKERSKKISEALTGTMRTDESKQKQSHVQKHKASLLTENERKDRFGSHNKGKSWKIVDGKRVWVDKE